MRCNCVPKENKNRCGRRATQQVFAQYLRSGVVPVSSGSLPSAQNCCRTFGSGSVAAAAQVRSNPTWTGISSDCCFIDLMISQITLCQLLLNLLSTTLKNSFVNTATVKQVGQSFIVTTNIYYALLLISSTISLTPAGRYYAENL